MKLHRILGIAGAVTAYLFITICIGVSPWFNFYNNALSDLGNSATHDATSWIFNTGLILSGLLEASFAILVLAKNLSWKYVVWTIPLIIASIDLAMLGFFPENTGGIHLAVSIIFFAFIEITMLIYSYASWPLGSPVIGAVALIMGIASAIIWFAKWPWSGVAIQETVTSFAATFWLILICLFDRH